MNKIVKNLLALFFPNICVGCDRNDPIGDGLFCFHCAQELPKFSDISDNKALIESRVPLLSDSKLYGLYLFTKKGIVQNVLHKIKYGNRPDLARTLGEQLAQKINPSAYHAIIPVPIHYKKKRRRGYNQAEEIAKGMTKFLELPIYNDPIVKKEDSQSQTQMNRSTRRLNVAKIYDVGKPLPKHFTHVLLVDDVVTTGATLEVCIEKLKANNDVIVDLAFIALSV